MLHSRVVLLNRLGVIITERCTVHGTRSTPQAIAYAKYLFTLSLFWCFVVIITIFFFVVRMV